MFFKKKGESAGRGSVPIDRVSALSQRGMSDKDVIKQLKSEGYSYDEIEKGMLQAVKQGITPEEPYSPAPPTMRAAPRPPAPSRGAALPSWDDIYSGNPEEPATETELFEAEVPNDEELSPELAIEELVEGVVNEKWEKFQKRLESIEAEQHKIKVMISQVQQRKPAQSSSEDNKAEMEEVYKRMDDIEARIGGLEKAFKQFLPSLTRNIESLAKMVHEMKESRE
ncbi:MAG: hypothetical protein HZB66_02700 [Candidatus Aenigmarchaeota archaeon]|nr:hypothetical protein [Candidatus Aenigmarchaeota archaeon]